MITAYAASTQRSFGTSAPVASASAVVTATCPLGNDGYGAQLRPVGGAIPTTSSGRGRSHSAQHVRTPRYATHPAPPTISSVRPGVVVPQYRPPTSPTSSTITT